jgi:methylmalonyl-CoA mutase
MQPKINTEQDEEFSIAQRHGLNIKPLYTVEDLKGLEHLSSSPGQEPYLRGPYASMYTQRPWTIRQYAGFGDAKTTNKLYVDAIRAGAKGLSVAFDLPTHRSLDSDNAMSEGDVGKAGVAIDSVEDIKILFRGVPLNEVSVSMTMNGAVLPIMASFIVAAEEMGFPLNELSGTIQNDILKEFMVRNTYIFSPEFSLRVASDVVEYNAKHLPKFNSMSISGYHFQEAGADPVLELALTLANAKTYIEHALAKGLDVNEYCEKLSFFFCVGSNFYLEIAKLRAARVLWSEILTKLGVTSKKAKALRMHCQTSGWSLIANDPLNNIARTTAQAMAAAFGGTQSLHTNSYDEAYSLPTTEAAKVARDTQKILQSETGICNVVDPWAGSYMMEKLTADVVTEVNQIFEEIQSKGGMLKALEAQWVQTVIQTRAADTQAKLDSGSQMIVGNPGNQHQTQILQVDSQSIRQDQTTKLTLIKQSRDALKVKRALKHLTSVGKSQIGNLLEATIDAIRCRATIQECTEALEKVSGRYQQRPLLINGTYAEEMNKSAEWTQCLKSVSEAKAILGRAPRVLVAKLGQDGHDRGLNVISAILSDAGCIVKQVPLFTDVESTVNIALEFRADLIALSSLANAHSTLTPKLLKILKDMESEIPVALGGIIPKEHHKSLIEQGVSYLMEPGKSISFALADLMKIVAVYDQKSIFSD